VAAVDLLLDQEVVEAHTTHQQEHLQKRTAKKRHIDTQEPSATGDPTAFSTPITYLRTITLR